MLMTKIKSATVLLALVSAFIVIAALVFDGGAMWWSPTPEPRIDAAPARPNGHAVRTDDGKLYSFAASWYPDGREVTVITSVNGVHNSTHPRYSPFERAVFVHRGDHLMMSISQVTRGTIICVIYEGATDSSIVVVGPQQRTSPGAKRCEWTVP